MSPAKSSSSNKNEPAGKRRGINSVEISIKILDAITELEQPASLTDISNKVGMGVSQTHRYVSSFLNCGILRQEPNSTLYKLGPKALQIGLSAIAANDPISLTDIMARQFSIENRATILMTVWGNNGPTIIRWYHGQPPIYTILTIGSVLPVTQSATGRMFMAHLPESFVEPMLKNEGWKKLNYYWIYFFIFVAILNEIVWRTQSELFWVNFKVWGLLPITIMFTATTIPIIKKYKLEKK